MRIAIPGHADAYIDIEEGALPEDVAEAFAATEAGKALADKVGKASYFEAWPLEQDMDDGIAVEIAKTYAEGGIDAVMELAISQDWDSSVEDCYESSTKDDLERALRDFVETATDEADWIDGDELTEACCEALKDRLFDAMREGDTSTFEGSIPSHVRVETGFIPDYNALGVDDMHMSHWDVCFSAETAIPDSNLMRFLKFMNVAPSEFIETCRTRGFDPSKPSRGEGMSDYRWKQAEESAQWWRAILDAEAGRDEEISKLLIQDEHAMAEWNSTVELVRTGKDYDRPTLVPMDDIFTMMTEASYGGVPVWAAKLPLRELLAGKFDKPFTATGGVVGIHDFINGSGYLDVLRGEIRIDPATGGYRHSTAGRWSIDDVYGFVGSVWRAETGAWEKSEWVRNRPNGWTRSAGDGKYATVSLSKGDDGVDEYWVHTFDKDGAEAGPRTTAEVFADLDSAKADADEALAVEWEAAPKP